MLKGMKDILKNNENNNLNYDIVHKFNQPLRVKIITYFYQNNQVKEQIIEIIKCIISKNKNLKLNDFVIKLGKK